MIAGELTVNGRRERFSAGLSTTLLHVLRDQLGLTGTKSGCDYGVCGACTVTIDGRPARACLALALAVDGRAIGTIEGVADRGTLDPVQAAILARGLQCGFCIPGIVMAARALLAETPDPSEAEIREALSGNLCRCSGYSSFVAAIQDAAAARHG